ncbi:unnamed protein product [Polarella glacialis]|uniref:XPG-I domain-containing protein n=1 Tax=Polarella glacialis TaxID=89957 RepID=A0A813H7X8_POLGL|nr:unnamed protein product [Polarella glacialis]
MQEQKKQWPSQPSKQPVLEDRPEEIKASGPDMVSEACQVMGMAGRLALTLTLTELGCEISLVCTFLCGFTVARSHFACFGKLSKTWRAVGDRNWKGRLVFMRGNFFQCGVPGGRGNYKRHGAMLRSSGVEPVLVFDGEALPGKRSTNDERRRRRVECRAEGERRFREGDLAGARSCLAQAVEVAPQVVADVVQELNATGARFIVAPYEADAQMVYLSLHGHVDFCITEDSDLLALGCERVLYKMKADGQGREIQLRDALDGRSLEEFQAVCVLMGCDYLPRLPRVGPALALMLVDSCGPQPHNFLKEVQGRGLSVPAGYERHFGGASWFEGQDLLPAD